MIRVTAVIIVGVLLSLSFGCQPSTEVELPGSKLQRIALEIGGHDYTIGDIVLLDTEKEIEPGDVVLYSYSKEGSLYGRFGPDQCLARIIGLPGDRVNFGDCSYESNGYQVSLDCSPGKWPRTKPTIWGNTPYEDAANMELIVPEGEYLADAWVGWGTVPGEKDETGSSVHHNRFTVKGAGMLGVVVEKVRHDSELEEKFKSRVY